MGYEEEFNKQLANNMKWYRQNQPNHIPVYAMKYKNASKFLIQDLKEPISLFPKKFKLKTIFDKIKQESLQYSKLKFNNNTKFKALGDKFQKFDFYLYTISIKDFNEQKTKKIKGQFVNLDLQMTIGQAFDKYGRDNILTVVYTDATELKNIWDINNTSFKQKRLMWIVAFIILLIILPMLIGEQPKKINQQNSNLYKPSHLEAINLTHKNDQEI